MRAWLNGDLMADPTQGAVAVNDHGFTVGDGVFEAVKTLRGTPFALTRHLARLERSRRRARAARTRPRRRTTWRRGVSLRGRPDRAAADHLHRRAAPDGLGTRRRPADAGRGLQRHRARGPPRRTVVTVPWTRNEHGATAGLKTTSYAENVIALAHAAERGGHRGDLRQHGRPPVRGHRLQRVLRRRRRAAHAEPGVGLPRRHHPGAGHRVVAVPGGRRAAGRRPRTAPARRSSPPRRATSRPSPAGTTATCPRPDRSRRRCAETWAAREAETMEP